MPSGKYIEFSTLYARNQYKSEVTDDNTEEYTYVKSLADLL